MLVIPVTKSQILLWVVQLHHLTVSWMFYNATLIGNYPLGIEVLRNIQKYNTVLKLNRTSSVQFYSHSRCSMTFSSKTLDWPFEILKYQL